MTDIIFSDTCHAKQSIFITSRGGIKETVSERKLTLMILFKTSWCIYSKIWYTLDSKVHGAIMGPTWILYPPGGPHVGPMNYERYHWNTAGWLNPPMHTLVIEFICHLPPNKLYMTCALYHHRLHSYSRTGIMSSLWCAGTSLCNMVQQMELYDWMRCW